MKNTFVEYCRRLSGYSLELDSLLFEKAYELTLQDVQYHSSDHINRDSLAFKIVNSQKETAIFIYRLGSLLLDKKYDRERIVLSGLMNLACSCEIYFNNEIETGFLPVHTTGIVMGSRNKIGKGFRIFQGATLGHRESGRRGCTIGDDVVLYANSSILGEVGIGDKVVIGAHSIITKDVDNYKTVKGVL